MYIHHSQKLLPMLRTVRCYCHYSLRDGCSHLISFGFKKQEVIGPLIMASGFPKADVESRRRKPEKKLSRYDLKITISRVNRDGNFASNRSTTPPPPKEGNVVFVIGELGNNHIHISLIRRHRGNWHEVISHWSRYGNQLLSDSRMSQEWVVEGPLSSLTTTRETWRLSAH